MNSKIFLYGGRILVVATIFAINSLFTEVFAQEQTNTTDANVGPVTNLPLPRFVSLKASKGNARRGPGLSHRVDWEFLRRGMPLQITAEFGHWRRVVDSDGAGGWVHYTLLSGARMVIVTQPEAIMKSEPNEHDASIAVLEHGVVPKLGTCEPNWCIVSIDGYEGWVNKSSIWGVGADEIRE